MSPIIAGVNSSCNNLSSALMYGNFQDDSSHTANITPYPTTQTQPNLGQFIKNDILLTQTSIYDRKLNSTTTQELLENPTILSTNRPEQLYQTDPTQSISSLNLDEDMYCLNTLDEPQYLSSIFDEDNNMQIAIKSSEESYKSDECHFESEWKDNFTGDILNNHTVKKPFKCNFIGCNSYFSRKDHVKRHMMQVHTRKKPFKCNVTGCDRYFNRKDNCKQHQLTHKREETSVKKPFKCNFTGCNQSFSRKDNFKRHEKRHTK